MRPLLTAMPPIPLPMPIAFHTSGGPSFGHSLRSPVSFETALRSGPCHCGQSSARAVRVNDRYRATADKAVSDVRRAVRLSILFLFRLSISVAFWQEL